MLRTQRPLFLLLLGVLLLVPLGHAATADVRATATIEGSGTSYRIVVRNAGDEPLRCFGLLLDGVQPTAATGPAGVLTRAGVYQGKGLVHMQRQTSDVAAPGATATASFTTNVPIPANAGGEIRYSSTCQPGSDQVGRATGPTPPRPDPNPCKCQKLEWAIGRGRTGSATVLNGRRPGSFELRLAGIWRLACSHGDGGCRATMSVTVPPAMSRDFGVRLLPRKTKEWRGGTQGTIVCREKCGRTTTGKAFAFDVSGGPKLGFGKRGVTTKSITLVVVTSCGGKSRRTEMTIVFRRDGGVDGDASDFNGNDVPDGREGSG